jgi:hypothetical protein
MLRRKSDSHAEMVFHAKLSLRYNGSELANARIGVGLRSAVTPALTCSCRQRCRYYRRYISCYGRCGLSGRSGVIPAVALPIALLTQPRLGRYPDAKDVSIFADVSGIPWLA